MRKLPESGLSFADFSAFDWTPPTTVIAPWLPLGGLGLIYGPGGVGKTYFSLACAMSITEGRSRLPHMHINRREEGWRVLYVDGEMQAAQFLERFGKLDKHTPFTGAPRFSILTHAAFRDGLPDLLKPEGQKLVQATVEKFDAHVVFLDNISALVRSGDANSEESMKPFLNWLVDFRRQNRSVVVVHHTGHIKPDEPMPHARGTSSFNDKMDAALLLRGLKEGKCPERIPVELFYRKHRFFVPKTDSVKQACCFDEADTMCWFDDNGGEPAWLEEAKERRSEGMSSRKLEAHLKAEGYTGVPSYKTLQRLPGPAASQDGGK